MWTSAYTAIDATDVTASVLPECRSNAKSISLILATTRAVLNATCPDASWVNDDAATGPDAAWLNDDASAGTYGASSRHDEPLKLIIAADDVPRGP